MILFRTGSGVYANLGSFHHKTTNNLELIFCWILHTFLYSVVFFIRSGTIATLKRLFVTKTDGIIRFECSLKPLYYTLHYTCTYLQQKGKFGKLIFKIISMKEYNIHLTLPLVYFCYKNTKSRKSHGPEDNDAPTYLRSLFERLSQNTIRELRNTKTDIKLPLLKTSSGQKCLVVIVP